jgi:outer membrane protein OmpA-like peptidoglycan-associated protein
VNDVFAFLISGPGINGVNNLARIPNTDDPVTVDHINQYKNSHYFIENKLWIPSNYEYFRYNDWAGELSYTYQFDGFTTILTAKCAVEPFSRYHIKIAIADVGDDIYDSGVFLEAGSFKSFGITRWKDTFIDKLTEELKIIDDIKIINDSNDVRILADVNFTFDSYQIPQKYHDFLDIIVKTMINYPTKTIIIEGHTDDLGSDDYNFRLSYQRAEAITNYLINSGISKYRINFKGHGNTKPMSTNITEKGRSINRRVEFSFIDN